MSAVNNNAFTSGFPVSAGAAPEFGSVPSGVLPQASGSRDSIGPLAQPVLPSRAASGSSGWSGWGGGWNNGSSDSGLAGFNSIMNGFVTALQNVLSSLGAQFGLTSSSGASATPAETFFMSATGSSVGDPHESFNGTPSSGSAGNQSWDSMNSHAALLSSDSFNGGYQVSTTVTSPNDKGVTTNAQAQVALDDGATKITMNEDGSWSVFANGGDISLERGQTQSLGNGESVSVNADSSLRVSANDGSGGSLVTTLAARDGGVDVKSTATNVDLGGYLVTHSDDAGPAPVRDYGAVSHSPISYAYDPAAEAGIEDRPSVMV